MAFVVEKHDKEPVNERKMRPGEILRMDDLECKPLQLHITVWFLDLNGDHIGRYREGFCITPFDGAKPILSLPIFPKEYIKKDKGLHVSLSTKDTSLSEGSCSAK